jgi:uncharacterized protein YcbX
MGVPAGPGQDGLMLTVAAVRRYPVKSMLGEELERAAVAEAGVVGDRHYAVIDQQTGMVASAKQPRLWRGLLTATAVGVDGSVRVRLPGYGEQEAGDPALDDLLSRFVGRPVRLADAPTGNGQIERADPDQVSVHGVDAEVDAPTLTLGGGSPGPTFRDYAPLHLITTATLQALGASAVRYRPNLVLETPAGVAPFAENEWVGSSITVGQDVVLRVVMLTPRCAVPTLRHGDLPADRDALRAAHRLNRVDVPGHGINPCAGVYATVEIGGTAHADDAAIVH